MQTIRQEQGDLVLLLHEEKNNNCKIHLLDPGSFLSSAGLQASIESVCNSVFCLLHVGENETCNYPQLM